MAGSRIQSRRKVSIGNEEVVSEKTSKVLPQDQVAKQSNKGQQSDVDGLNANPNVAGPDWSKSRVVSIRRGIERLVKTQEFENITFVDEVTIQFNVSNEEEFIEQLNEQTNAFVERFKAYHDSTLGQLYLSHKKAFLADSEGNTTEMGESGFSLFDG